jgi:3-deoxy-manno-octulosonate cytidylyltransferase (CMP-KDO synthetase)|tara:strand:+ start:565 stop:1335 length:771 start_codon:yes stop_codon:yes gene_type:complete
MTKIIGVVPARMKASRFHGKPLHNILGRPMIEHVFLRAQKFKKWNSLTIATCDDEIIEFAKKNDIPSIMTKDTHTRALDRVAEAALKIHSDINKNDIVVCVQGDEPMLEPEMIEKVIEPLQDSKNISCSVLAMHITDEELWLNKDTVKIIHNDEGKVLYTSRSPIPYSKDPFSSKLFARRIYGIFAFRWQNLEMFVNHEETRLEQIESCDSNRILDMTYDQYIAPYPSRKSFSVDSPNDINIVEKHMINDKYYGTY